jgi:hypothetical protein
VLDCGSNAFNSIGRYYIRHPAVLANGIFGFRHYPRLPVVKNVNGW